MRKKNLTLKQFSLRFSLAIIVALLANSIFLLVIQQSFKDVLTIQRHREATMALMGELRQETELLTLFVRAYTSTGQTPYLTYYYDVLAIRQGEKPKPENYVADGGFWDRVIAGEIQPQFSIEGEKHSLFEQMKSLGFSDEEFAIFDQILGITEAMKRVEQIAFAATQGLYDPVIDDFVSDGKPQMEFANQLVHSQRYNRLKSDLARHLAMLTSKVDERTNNAVHDAEWELEQWIFLTFCNVVFTFALVIAASQVIHRRVLRPIHRLSDTAEKLAHGDYSARVKIGSIHQQVKHNQSVDELVALAKVFNDMAASIEQDIARRLGIQVQLALANDKAEEATRAKSMFLANMSHEIRTPMNAIIGMVYLTLKTELNLRQKNYLTEVYTAAKSLLGIINDILDFSKVEAGKLELEQSPFLLEEVLNNSLTLLRQRAHEKEIELLLNITDSALLEADRVFIGDPLRLGQVITNLVSNSIKFTHQGYVKLTVGIEKREAHQMMLNFSLCDTGIGMSTEQVDRLFHEFTQADGSMTRKYGGTGLGLTIAEKFVELMGGKICVESELGKGSCFRFTAGFPLAMSLPLQANTRWNLSSLRVMVVDDQPEARMVLSGMLTLMGIGADIHPAVTGVADAQEALLLLEQAANSGRPYDWLFLDWVMPGMSGEKLLQAIQDFRVDNRPSVAIVSAHDSDFMYQAAEKLGVQHFLVKPVMPDALRKLFGIKQNKAVNQWVDVGEVQETQFSGMQVLLVEDNPINQRLACELMESHGVKVTIANTGQEAIAILDGASTGYYQLVLMDLQMPVMDGYEATRILRANSRYATLPIIAMTAHAMHEEREYCLQIGMNGHLSKPIEPEIFYQTLAQFAPCGVIEKSPVRQQVELPLPEIAGINSVSGLRRANGNRKLYREMLAKFVQDFAGSGLLLAQFLADEQWEKAKQLSHTLKGLTATLGMNDMAIKASDFELACKHRQLQEATIALTAMMDLLTPLINQLQQFFSSEVLAVTAETSFQNLDDFPDCFRELQRLLMEGESSALDLWENQYQIFSQSLSPEAIVRINNALQNFDFDLASTLLYEAFKTTPKQT